MSDRLRNMSNLAQNKAEVSIIIPTYNESENIIQVLKSIGEHISKDIATEAIVVDDNSPNETQTLKGSSRPKFWSAMHR